MITWICKRAALAGLCLGLAACDRVDPAGFIGGLIPGGKVENVALSQTLMANGAFTLVPPDGFCIDKDTLRQQFALMARCDTLGAPRLAGGAPVGLITVSVTALAPDAPLSTAQEIADASKLSRIDSAQASNEVLTFRAEGSPPAKGLDALHWRSVARVKDQMLGIALYGPKDARAVSEEGRDILQSLIRRSRRGK
jgi:hypothetical protein